MVDLRPVDKANSVKELTPEFKKWLNEERKIPNCPRCKAKMYQSQYSFTWYCRFCLDVEKE